MSKLLESLTMQDDPPSPALDEPCQLGRELAAGPLAKCFILPDFYRSAMGFQQSAAAEPEDAGSPMASASNNWYYKKRNDEVSRLAMRILRKRSEMATPMINFARYINN